MASYSRSKTRECIRFYSRAVMRSMAILWVYPDACEGFKTNMVIDAWGQLNYVPKIRTAFFIKTFPSKRFMLKNMLSAGFEDIESFIDEADSYLKQPMSEERKNDVSGLSDAIRSYFTWLAEALALKRYVTISESWRKLKNLDVVD